MRDMLYYLITNRGDDHTKLTLTLSNQDFEIMEKAAISISEQFHLPVKNIDIIPITVALSHHYISNKDIDVLKIRFTDNEPNGESLGRIGLREFRKMTNSERVLNNFYIRHAYQIPNEDYKLLEERVNKIKEEQPTQYKFGISSFVRQCIHLIDYNNIDLNQYYQLHNWSHKKLVAALL